MEIIIWMMSQKLRICKNSDWYFRNYGNWKLTKKAGGSCELIYLLLLMFKPTFSTMSNWRGGGSFCNSSARHDVSTVTTRPRLPSCTYSVHHREIGREIYANDNAYFIHIYSEIILLIYVIFWYYLEQKVLIKI